MFDGIRPGQLQQKIQTPAFTVNISGQSLENPIFIQSIVRYFKLHPRVVNKIAFEISESSQIRNLAATNTVIQGLREAGHSVCLDDFDIGSSAIQRLRDLQVDFVKVDGLHIRQAIESTTDEEKLKAMVGLCDELGVAAVAERVEDENTVSFLSNCGFQFGQGYFVGKPRIISETNSRSLK